MRAYIDLFEFKSIYALIFLFIYCPYKAHILILAKIMEKNSKIIKKYVKSINLNDIIVSK